jgi:hypothetical protein
LRAANGHSFAQTGRSTNDLLVEKTHLKELKSRQNAGFDIGQVHGTFPSQPKLELLLGRMGD